LTRPSGTLTLPMTMESYQQFRPIEALRSLVDAYWINRPAAVGRAVDNRVLPDGCIDLVFRGGGADGGELFSSALIERPVPLGGDAGWFVGVRFRPAMARAILDIDPIACRDRAARAADIDARLAALEDMLRDCTSPEQALTLLKRTIDARLMRLEREVAPARVRQAIALLARGSDVRGAARSIGSTERSLHRDLTRWSGLAPKTLARILRMQRCLAAIRAGRAPLAIIALHFGYADQAHMTRELKELAGATPAEIARANGGSVRNLQDAA
jgi:AraC-like DNA-binding protein